MYFTFYFNIQNIYKKRAFFMYIKYLYILGVFISIYTYYIYIIIVYYIYICLFFINAFIVSYYRHTRKDVYFAL